MAYVLPTGHNDPGDEWTSEESAYDNNTGTWALRSNLNTASWTNFLELTHASLSCDKVRFYNDQNIGGDLQADIDVYYGGVWNHVFLGNFTNATYVECALGAIYSVTALRVSLYNGTGSPQNLRLCEAHFNQIVAPTVTTQNCTNITDKTATGNGNITATGGENATVRGFCYMVGTSGDPTTANSVVYDEGSFGIGAYTKGITGLSPATGYRVRAYAVNSIGTSYGATVQLTTASSPTVTTQAASSILTTTVTANGTITALGLENSTVRGFQYGLTKVATWNVSDSGSFGLGAFTKGLTGLSANTTYWIRAYATNSIGTGYGEWIEFQTSASGIIPTGTNLFICGDYSGYVYKLMRAETDDGFTFTGYFVLTTDLANKSGLSYYKRILDIDLYLKSESAGTIEIYVKRDSEASWVSLGSVSLIGAEEIIIKHLAVDIRAKHFLFKISSTNAFRFLGILFEYLPEDMR